MTTGIFLSPAQEPLHTFVHIRVDRIARCRIFANAALRQLLLYSFEFDVVGSLGGVVFDR